MRQDPVVLRPHRMASVFQAQAARLTLTKIQPTLPGPREASVISDEDKRTETAGAGANQYVARIPNPPSTAKVFSARATATATIPD